jgi:arginine-tRNA-protein transferase
MKILSAPKLSDIQPCPYLDNRDSVQEFFFALEMSDVEIEILISNGWRKFGAYIFRPSCLTCKECRPTRIDVKNFTLNKKQRKLVRKSEDIKIEFLPLHFKEEFYEIFKDHSKNRFNQTPSEIGDIDSFKETFFIKTCPSEVCIYSLDEKIIAWGIIDIGTDSLSSVYFAFDTNYSKLELGKLSILKEIEHAKKLGLSHYHLGYYIEGNKSMAYKATYSPRQFMSWEDGKWLDQE